MVAKNSRPDAGLTFPKSSRLLTDQAYRQVLDGRNKKLRRDGYTMVRASAQPPHSGKLGFKVGKRHLPRAVDRNRIKRLVREAFRLSRAHAQPHSWVFISRPGIGERLQDTGELRRELGEMLVRGS